MNIVTETFLSKSLADYKKSREINLQIFLILFRLNYDAIMRLDIKSINMDNIITSKSKKMSMNDTPLLIKLMNHQRAVIYKMIMMELKIDKENHHRYAMLSDKVGSGKTYCVLAYLYIMNKMIYPKKKPNVNIIVVPYNICSQWRNSLQSIFGPSGNIIKYSLFTEYSDIMKLYTNTEALFEYDILLTTSLYFDNIAKTINSLNLKVNRVVFDETDTIANVLSVELICELTWFVSASMSSLFKNNETVDIGNYHLNFRKLKEQDICCDPEFINENIILPHPEKNIIRCENLYRNLLRSITSQENHEKIEAMDYRFIRSEFVRDMNNILDSEYKAVLYLFKHSLAQKANSLELIKGYKEDYEHYIKMLEFDKAKVIQNLINENEVIVRNCQNLITTVDIFKSKHGLKDFEEIINEAYTSKSTEIKNLIKNIYEKNPKAQTMIFSNHDYIFNFLKQFLVCNNISFKEMDGGNVSKMDNIISGFKNHEFSLLFADASMFYSGMNLENITDIIFIHNMEEIKEKQVIGRAQRFGNVKVRQR